MFADSAVALAVLVIILGVGKVLASQVVSSQESPTSNGIKPSFHHRLVNKYVGSYRVQRSRSVRGFSRASIPSRVSSTFLVRASNGVLSGLPWKNPFKGDHVEAWAVCLSKKSSTIRFSSCLGTDPVSLPEHQMNSLACIQWPCCRTFTQF